MFPSTGPERINEAYVMCHYVTSQQQLLGSVYMLALRNLLGSQANTIFTKKKRIKKVEASDLHALLGQLNVTLACQHLCNKTVSIS